MHCDVMATTRTHVSPRLQYMTGLSFDQIERETLYRVQRHLLEVGQRLSRGIDHIREQLLEDSTLVSGAQYNYYDL